MPRFFIRRERKPRDHKFKVYQPWWMDPYWWIKGTSIEKMVMAELSRRGIYFQYRPQTNTLGGFVDPTWEADFLLPQHKIWIEVQGSYFHSLPGQIENDAFRYAAITMAGWRPIFLWEFDIRNRLPELLDEIPEFYYVNMVTENAARVQFGTSPGLTFFAGGSIDQLAGLRKALSNRTKPPQLRVVRRNRIRRPK